MCSVVGGGISYSAGLVGRDVWCPERCVGPACSVSNQRPCSVRVL